MGGGGGGGLFQNSEGMRGRAFSNFSKKPGLKLWKLSVAWKGDFLGVPNPI